MILIQVILSDYFIIKYPDFPWAGKKKLFEVFSYFHESWEPCTISKTLMILTHTSATIIAELLTRRA